MATQTQSIQAQRDLYYAARKNRKKMQRIAGLVGLQLLLTVLLISFLVPALWMVSSSLKAPTEIFAHPIVWFPEQPRWRNYAEAFNTLPLARFAWNTFVVVAIAVVGTVISSAMVAYSFARMKWPGRTFWFALLIGTMLLPEIIMLIPRFIIFRNLPAFGIQGSRNWLDTFLPLTVPYWLAGTPLYVFLVRQFFRGIPVELDEAAYIDGASRFQILFRILLPLSKPVLATVAVFALLQHYTDFLQPLIYLNRMQNWTLALGINAFNESYTARWELIFAAGTVMVIPMIIVFIFAQRYFVEGIAMTGFGGR
jgi:ABC-type glycerol-3-phosphate transport system permease component